MCSVGRIVGVRIALLVAVFSCGCSKPAASRSETATARAAQLVLLTRDGCMNTDLLRKNLDAAISRFGRPVPYDVVDQGTLAETDPRRGYPTPTLLFANRDLFGLPEPKPPFPEPA